MTKKGKRAKETRFLRETWFLVGGRTMRSVLNSTKQAWRGWLEAVLVFCMPFSVSITPFTSQASDVSITVQVAGTPTAIDARMLGTNLAAWMAPDAMSNPTFRARTIASGVTVVRMPGGSWSNAYGWLSCEKRATQTGALPCGPGWESWAARPTDFINFLNATSKQGMWTVNINGTAKEAAAAVAFFNARITDTTSIGVDIRGTDWYTAGHWAQLRADHGNLEPVGIKLWDVGNEVYGGKLNAGTNCTASWGWEDVWTCDGTEYAYGIGSGTSRHEGFIEYRTAMRAVDPSIQVGAVGVAYQTSWSDWGVKVISATGQIMDFYDVHQYAYNSLPGSYATALSDVLSTWATQKADIDAGFTTYAGGRQVPIGMTEYNLISSWTQDTSTWMTRTVNALYMADSLGQMMANGYSLANQWLLNGNTQANGTDYGLLHVDAGYARSPQYYAYVLWSRFGSQMLPHASTASATALSVYAGRASALNPTLLAINKTGQSISATIYLSGSVPLIGAQADVARGASLDAGSMTLNGVAEGALANDLSNAPATSVPVSADHLTYSFAPYSITLLRMQLAFTPTAYIYLPLVMR
jgi:hypothetical protein